MTDDVAESRMHLRSSAGQIQGVDRMRIDYAEQCLDDIVGHRFGSRGTGVDMAMQTALIALIGQIHLQHLQRPAGDGRKIQLVQ